MVTQAYCNRCKCKKNIIHQEIKEVTSSTRGKTRFCVGNCEDCGRRISVFLPKYTEVEDGIPKYTNGKIKELEEKIEAEKKKEMSKMEEEKLRQQKEIDRQKLEKFFESSKENPIIQRNKDIIEVVNKTEKKVVSKNYYNLLIVALIIFGVAIGFFGYQTLYPENFLPNYNSTCEVSETFICNNTNINTEGDCNCGDSYCNITIPKIIEVRVINGS